MSTNFSEKFVSILMPVFNAGLYLKSCLKSVLDQTHEDWELIAINDFSTDNSLEILLNYQNKDSRIKVLNNNHKGIIPALRLAFKNSKFPLIHRMDADDIMPNSKLEKMIKAYQNGAVVTGMVKYFSDEWLVGLGFQNYAMWLNNLMNTENLWEDIYKECPLPSPAWLMHRETLISIGAFNSNLIPEDYDLAFRLYLHNIPIITIKEIIHLWRDSQNRTSRKNAEYFPMAYFPLKVYYFLKIDFDKSKDLILWGAGKKGKSIARELIKHKINFLWVTNNVNKINKFVYKTKVLSDDDLEFNNKQIIIAISSPADKILVQQRLNFLNLKSAKDYFWFC